MLNDGVNIFVFFLLFFSLISPNTSCGYFGFLERIAVTFFFQRIAITLLMTRILASVNSPRHHNTPSAVTLTRKVVSSF